MRLSQFSLGQKLHALPTYVIAALTVIALSSVPAYAAKPTTKKNGGNGGNDGSTSQDSTSYTPMAIEYEDYFFRYPSLERDCLGEDDELAWKAIGGLKPGESFTFTPQYPGCENHPAAITVNLSWQDSELELSSYAPDKDFASWDPSQKDKLIVAPTVDNTAQLCMFPAYKASDIYYTITVTNVGTTTANNIVLDGRSDNDWAINFYNRCLNADADNDGWNDSLEHSMANMTYRNGYIDGVYQPYILWGSNYLKATADTLAVDDEIDSSPVDFNDDGVVDSLDVDEINRNLGEGNGIPLERISPNSADAEFLKDNDLPWRRYDLDGDGYVDQTDIEIVETLLGEALPMVEDIIAPTARVLEPEGGSVAKGSNYLIRGHVWDNAAIERVEYLADGKVLCSVTDPVPSFGTTSPFYACWWSVPKRQGLHDLEIRVYDAAGNMATSDTLSVMAN